jgi:hypothetical protein
MRGFWAGAVALLAASSATGQAIQQSGAVVPFHSAAWFQNGVLADAGTPQTPFISSLGLFNGSSCPFGISSQTGPGLSTSPYAQFSICQTNTTTTLNVAGVNGQAPPSINFNVGGTTYPFPAGGGNVSAPSTTVLGTAACFNATNGGLIKNCGADVSVIEQGGNVGGGGDDSAAFQAAVNILPTAGGRITVPSAAYIINTAPTWGNKSIYWDISPSATFSGAGATTFPLMTSNVLQKAVGPWIQSQSTVASPGGGIGGIASFSSEMIQPAAYNGNSVSIYSGALGSSTSGNVWAANFLVQSDTGAGGTYQGLELDVNDFAAGSGMIGLNLDGTGTSNPTYGISLVRADSSLWGTAIRVANAINGITIAGNSNMIDGIVIGSPSAGLGGAAIFRKLTNGTDDLVLQRFTDVAPAGYLIRAVNAANNTNLMSVDVSGSVAGNSFSAVAGLSSGSPVGGIASNFQALQQANGDDVFFAQRATDTSPTGTFMRCVNAANTVNLCQVDINGNFGGSSFLAQGTNGVGYFTGAGGAVTQLTSRTTAVTLNKTTGAVTLFTAAGSATPATFTVTDSAVAASDTIILNEKSGSNLYEMFVTAVSNGSFNVTFFTTGGTTSDAPVMNFSVIKGASS